MIGKPQFGWSKITIAGKNQTWSDRISYLDDVPFDLLHALIDSCKNHRPVAVKFDAEGYEYIIVFEWVSVYVIYQGSNIIQCLSKDKTQQTSLVAIDAKRADVATELIADIREATAEWAEFWYDAIPETNEKEELEQRKEELLKLCDELESLLPADDYTIVHRADSIEIDYA